MSRSFLRLIPDIVVCSSSPSSSHKIVMLVRTIQVLVPARRASPFSTRQLHSLPSPSTRLAPFSKRHFSHKTDPLQDNSLSPFSLWSQIREARPAVRYTVYAGVGLMITAESTFWLNVIRAKYFPSAREDEKEKAERFLRDLQAAVQGFRAVWMENYGRYYGSYVWGLEYGGLGGSEDQHGVQSMGATGASAALEGRFPDGTR